MAAIATIAGSLLVDGLPRSGATAKLWPSGAAFLTTPPQKNTALPLTGSPSQSTTTGPTHGADGAYRFTGVTAGVYYVSLEWNDLIVYDSFEIPPSGTPSGIASVKAYGAVGDGITNDTTAIQAALDDTAVNELYFPPGTYLCGTVQLQSRAGLRLTGSGATLQWTGIGTNTVPIGLQLTGLPQEVTIEGLRFLGSGTATDYHAGVWWTTGVTIANLRITGCRFEDLAVGVWSNAGTLAGIWIENNFFTNLVGTGATQGTGVYVTNAGTSPLGVTIARNVFELTARHAIHIARGVGVRILENQSKTHGSDTLAVVAAIEVGRVQDLLIKDNTLHGYTDGGIAVIPTGGATVSRVVIEGNTLIEPGNAIQDINIGTSDPATNGGVEQLILRGNQIKKTGVNIFSIVVQHALRSHVEGNQVSLLLVSSGQRAGISLSGAGDSGGTRTYTDDLILAENLIYGTTAGGTVVGMELGSALCTSTARVLFRGNRVQADSTFAIGATITNDDNLQVVDQPTDGLTYTTGTYLTRTINGPLAMDGTIDFVVLSTTSSITLTERHQIVSANANGGNITLTLPPIADCVGRLLTIIRTDSNAGFSVTLDPDGAETINGLASFVLDRQYECVQLVAGTTAWRLVSTSAGPWRTGAVRTITSAGSPATLTQAEQFVILDSSGGNITVNMPAQANSPGQVICFFKPSSSNDITLDGNGAETVDGGATDTIPNGTARLFGVIINHGGDWVWAFKNFA